MAVIAPSSCSRRSIGSTQMETIAKSRLEPAAVGAKQDGRTPGLQRQREAGSGPAGAERRQPPVAPLPSVAVRTMEHGPAVTRVEAANRGDLVGDSRRKQQEAARLFPSLAQRQPKTPGFSRDGQHLDARKDHTVSLELVTPQRRELGRHHAVARQVTVQAARAFVARMARVADQDTPPTAAKHERRAQSGWSSANDDDVEHSKAMAARPSPITVKLSI